MNLYSINSIIILNHQNSIWTRLPLKFSHFLCTQNQYSDVTAGGVSLIIGSSLFLGYRKIVGGCLLSFLVISITYSRSNSRIPQFTFAVTLHRGSCDALSSLYVIRKSLKFNESDYKFSFSES